MISFTRNTASASRMSHVVEMQRVANYDAEVNVLHVTFNGIDVVSLSL